MNTPHAPVFGAIPEELEALRTEARRFVDRQLKPVDDWVEANVAFKPESVKALRDMGYFGVVIPEEYGGLGLGFLAYVLIQEQLAHAHPAYNMLLSGNNGIGSLGLVLAGTGEQKKRFLPRLASGEVVAAFAITEPGAGSDAASIRTRAELKGDHYVLNGTKHFITRAEIAGLFTVLAVTGPGKGAAGISMFAIEKGTPGLRIGKAQPTMGTDVVSQAEVIMEDCLVPAENRIGPEGEGFKIAMRVLEEGRVNVSSRSVGIIDRMLGLSTEYARSRVQFGKPIAEFQGIQWKIADMAADLFSLRPLLYQTAARLDAGETPRKEIAALKLLSTEAAFRACDQALQIFGGMGYAKEVPVERYFREVRGYRIFEGTSEIQRVILARECLKT